MKLLSHHLVVLEMILNHDRYQELQEFHACDDDRAEIVTMVLNKVLRTSKHESEFQTFVNIEMESLYDAIK